MTVRVSTFSFRAKLDKQVRQKNCCDLPILLQMRHCRGIFFGQTQGVLWGSTSPAPMFGIVVALNLRRTLISENRINSYIKNVYLNLKVDLLNFFSI